ncbi:hypothetical protein [Aerosakkonema funiforme]|uniref:Uncharacterized protein n=1 Tax=Aerosakkonema funiforme FACHB-1375 TaxID=2949571 RepID=A0A926ZKP4_9CYAN|nr:hypothetical protein [Aerosakkonema funiforme]MBD2184206.1 hypothetical protein [Aerosakkonema funiforme FACHB-1375]
MSNWLSLLQKPENLGDAEAIEHWFTRIASGLLNGCYLVVGNEPHRLVEIEFYYCGDVHPDPFTHRDRLQLEFGRWYFHRTRGMYRGGSFKGLDMTFRYGFESQTTVQVAPNLPRDRENKRIVVSLTID